MKRHTVFAGLALAAVLSGGRPALAQNNPLVTINEFGSGTLSFPGGGGNFTTTAVLQPDPGPGGLSSALTYNLLGPPGLVAGDLIMLEAGTGLTVSDIIRFNPAGTASGYPASAVFYSENTSGVIAPADTGFPNALYANNVTVFETAQHTFVYTPTASQPGFITGFSATYSIISTPEPALPTLFCLAVGGGFAALRAPPPEGGWSG